MIVKLFGLVWDLVIFHVKHISPKLLRFYLFLQNWEKKSFVLC